MNYELIILGSILIFLFLVFYRISSLYEYEINDYYISITFSIFSVSFFKQDIYYKNIKNIFNKKNTLSYFLIIKCLFSGIKFLSWPSSDKNYLLFELKSGETICILDSNADYLYNCIIDKISNN